METTGQKLPFIIAGTIEPMGTTLAGQNIESFNISLEHLNPLSIGLNCATGPEFTRDHLRSFSALSRTAISCYPNAGLPDENGHYHESPKSLARKITTFAEQGWLNTAGGCCGTTPEHERKLPEALLYDTNDETLAEFVAAFRNRTVDKKVKTNDSPLEERLASYLVEGTKEGLIPDLTLALEKYSPLDMINGPLMKRMEEVGRLFNNNEMREVWGIPDPTEMTMKERFGARYQGIRVSFGYPACPNLEDQEPLFRLMHPEDIGVHLTEGFMMEPEASVTAIVFTHPQATYFNVDLALEGCPHTHN
ncbi:methionine synthase I [Paenibacillus popilliae ATCC 14706]|uniref:Methionine synthase I n=1 Tax=Paenibacillus popilliae ATCC 14706 TaxID=1212764 RepID=M9LKV8_PAEPP|nr:methionine synthase I [Paenibacillus popilliae ATCC 14706]